MYLIAKKFDEAGCIALETQGDAAIVALISYLGNRMLDKGIQIMTVSDTKVYGEYEPYHFVKSEKEFIMTVFDM